MTVAFDGVTLAADRLVIEEGHIISQRMNKIVRLSDNSYIAGEGDIDSVKMAIEWIKYTIKSKKIISWQKQSKAKPILEKDSVVLLRVKYGGPNYIYKYRLIPRKIDKLDRLIAIGSGSAFAMGALNADASAKRAVEIAAWLDQDTNCTIDTVNLIIGAKYDFFKLNFNDFLFYEIIT